MFGRWLLLCSVLVFHAGCAGKVSELPVVGDWTLDLSRTVYGSSVDRRVEERFVCSKDPSVLHCVILSTRENGKKVKAQFDAVLNGPAGDIYGVEGLNKVQVMTISPGVMEATFYDNDQPRYAYRSWRESHGRSLVIASIDPITREMLSTTVVYVRTEA
jgi:hypothetical protein